MITLSPSSTEEMLEIGFPPDHVEVVPPGIDPRFSPGAERTPTPTVLAAGRLVPVKRYDLLIRAVVEARRPVPDLKLTIVGTGPLRGELEELVDVARRAATRSASPAGCPTTSCSTSTGGRGSWPARRPGRAGA